MSATGTMLSAQSPSGEAIRPSTRLGAPTPTTAHANSLRPVPIQSVRPQPTAAPMPRNHSSLQWRRSARAPEPTQNRMQTQTQAVTSSPVSQAVWVSDSAQAKRGSALQVVSSPTRANFFEDPFGERNATELVQAPQLAQTQSQPPGQAIEMIVPPPAQLPAADPPPTNDLRSADGSVEQAPSNAFELPPPTQQAPPTQPAPAVESPPPSIAPESDQGEGSGEISLGEMLRDNRPSDGQQGDDSELPPPGADYTAPAFQDPPETDENPFPRGDRSADEADQDSFGGGYFDRMDQMDRTDAVGRPGDFSCEEFRERIAAQTIDLVSLDISPPFRPDEFDQAGYERLRAEFLKRQTSRQWRNIEGESIAEGRLIDLAYEKAVIETEDGQQKLLPVERLSEADLAYITDNWGLPQECLVEQVAFTPRQWAPMKVTWKASDLCHTPLYFQDVNLERYGHTHGPVLEPLVQSAHFFGNVLVLPYKMGVHSPHECQYALGYYRPGNCAPWIKPPVPISAKGAIAQAATMTGLFWLIP